MSVATLDESIIPVLENATDRVFIHGKDGSVLGFFQPVSSSGSIRHSPYSEAEIRAIQSNKGECISLAEVWKRLGVK
jgi:hypothetical protein